MKILIVRTIAIEEDLSKFTYNNQGIGLATELGKLGNECALVYYAKKGNKREETVISDGVSLKIYHIEGKNLVWNALYDDYLFEVCKEYDLIQTSECDQICSWQIYKRFPQKTVIYHGPYGSKFTWKYNLRSFVFDKIFSWRKEFRNATIITKSFLAEDYLRGKGFKNITTLGVGLNPFQLERQTEVLPSLINSVMTQKGKNKFLLYIGAISKRKNLLFLLEVFNILVNDRKHWDYKMIIVGAKAYREEGYYNKCFDYIKKNNIENHIFYLESVEQKYLKYLYENSDLYLLATQYDIFGMVYLEALYFGTPILTTLCGGSSLLIKEGETGYIRKLGDKEAWSNATEHILESQSKLDEMRKKGKRMIKEQYLWSKLAPHFLEVYHELLSRK